MLKVRWTRGKGLLVAMLVVTTAGVTLGAAAPTSAAPPAEHTPTVPVARTVPAAGVAGPARGQTRVGGAGMGPAGSVVPFTTTSYTSQNWAGYFTTNAAHTTDFKSVHARWVAPRVICPASGEAWVVSWVGMDGWWNNIVEQGGSSAYCFNGRLSYTLWWEMWPHNLIQTANPISAGDTIDATVSYNSSTAMFSIVVKDLTNGQTLTQNQPCYSDMGGCPRVNAEVVTETPFTTSGSVFALPNYGTVSYSSVSVTDVSGHTGPLVDSRWNLGRVNQVDPSSGITKQTTSAVGAGGASFSTTWAHA